MNLNKFTLETIEEYFVKGVLSDMSTGIQAEKEKAWTVYNQYEKETVNARAKRGN